MGRFDDLDLEQVKQQEANSRCLHQRVQEEYERWVASEGVSILKEFIRKAAEATPGSTIWAIDYVERSDTNAESVCVGADSTPDQLVGVCRYVLHAYGSSGSAFLEQDRTQRLVRFDSSAAERILVDFLTGALRRIVAEGA